MSGTANTTNQPDVNMSDINDGLAGNTAASSEVLASPPHNDDEVPANVSSLVVDEGATSHARQEAAQTEEKIVDHSNCEEEEEWSGDEDLPHDSYCPICLKTAELTLCQGCKDMAYCSEACQKTDRTVHKVLCRKLQPFTATTRPSDSHFRVILFPANRTDAATIVARPRFVWLNAGAPGAFRPLFPPRGDYHSVQCDSGMGRAWKFNSTQPLRIVDGVNQEMEQRNRCLDNIVGGKSVTRAWFDSVLIVGDRGHVTMRDYRAAIDYLQCNDSNFALVDPSRYLEPDQPPCICVLISPDCHRLEPAAELRVRQASMSLSMMKGRNTKHLSCLDNILLIDAVYDRGFRDRNENTLLIYVNHWLQILGEVPLPFSYLPIGTVVYLRRDGKPLLLQHYDALEAFVRRETVAAAGAEGKSNEEMMQLYHEIPGFRYDATEEQLRERLTDEKFRKFWVGYCAEKNLSESVVPCPLDM